MKVIERDDPAITSCGAIGEEPEASGKPNDLHAINLRHLRAFLRVAALKSVNRVATEINLSQPAISQAIMGLEETFETELFTRSATGMYLNAFGRIFERRVGRGFAGLSDSLAGVLARSSGPQSDDPSLYLRTGQLLVLIALDRAESLQTCARDLGVTVKSINRNVRNLEERIGRTVVLRDGARIRLTNAGEGICRASKLFFREIELAREEIATALGNARGRLVIGVMPLTRSFIAPRTAVGIAQRYPGLRLQLVEAPYPALVSGLRDGEIDLLIGALRDPPPSPDVAQEFLFAEKLCVVARNDHPCLSLDLGTIDDLAEYPWIAPRTDSPARQEFDRLMQAARRPPVVLLEAASHMAVRSVLLESDCLALISRHQIRYEERYGQLVVVPVELPTAPRAIGYSVRTDWQPTRLQEAFVAELRTVCEAAVADAGGA